jgi:hypothetical protein
MSIKIIGQQQPTINHIHHSYSFDPNRINQNNPQKINQNSFQPKKSILTNQSSNQQISESPSQQISNTSPSLQLNQSRSELNNNMGIVPLGKSECLSCSHYLRYKLVENNE